MFIFSYFVFHSVTEPCQRSSAGFVIAFKVLINLIGIPHPFLSHKKAIVMVFGCIFILNHVRVMVRDMRSVCPPLVARLAQAIFTGVGKAFGLRWILFSIHRLCSFF